MNRSTREVEGCILVLLLSLGGICGNISVNPFSILAVYDEIDGPGVGMYTQVRIPGDGTELPFISYYDADCGQLKGLRCSNELCSENNTISVVAGSCNKYPIFGQVVTGRYESQIIGSDGKPFFAYVNQFSIDSSKCGDFSCANSTNITTSIIQFKDAPFLDTAGYTAVTIGANGNPIIAYRNEINNTLDIASCNDLSCTSFVINQVNVNAGYPSIAIGPDGIPLLSLYNEQLAYLQYFRCNDEQCREGNITLTIIDSSSGDIGRYTYIQVGSDGLPIMMYVDEENGWMKVAHCGDLYCASDSVVISIIDEIGISAYGEFPEMQINPFTGFAVLVYFNQTNHTSSAAKVAQCLDLECTTALVQIIKVGNCGYGRDSSLAFAKNGMVYVSYMNYSPLSVERKLALAVLMQSSNSQSETNDHYYPFYLSNHLIKPRERNIKFTRSTDDICQSDYSYPPSI